MLFQRFRPRECWRKRLRVFAVHLSIPNSLPALGVISGVTLLLLYSAWNEAVSLSELDLQSAQLVELLFSAVYLRLNLRRNDRRKKPLRRRKVAVNSSNYLRGGKWGFVEGD